MRTFSFLIIFKLASALSAHGAMHRPAELPDSYRDFAIYATSQPDSTDSALIEMTIQMVNRGKRPLATSVSL